MSLSAGATPISKTADFSLGSAELPPVETVEIQLVDYREYIDAAGKRKVITVEVSPPAKRFKRDHDVEQMEETPSIAGLSFAEEEISEIGNDSGLQLPNPLELHAGAGDPEAEDGVEEEELQQQQQQHDSGVTENGSASLTESSKESIFDTPRVKRHRRKQVLSGKLVHLCLYLHSQL